MGPQTDFDLELEERRRVLDAWVAKRKQIATLEAEAAELLVEQITLHDADVSASPFHRDAIYRSMISEFSAAGHFSKGTVEFAFADAQALCTHLPAVRTAFASGALSPLHVREIARASAIVIEAIRNKKIDASAMALFEAAVLVVAEHDSAARTRAHARQIAATLTGESLGERHERATTERCVTVKSLDDGLALLTAVLPEWIAHAISDRLNRMTQQIVETRSNPTTSHDDLPIENLALEDPENREDEEEECLDTRTWAQIRTDLFSDLLLASDPSAVHGDGLDNIQARVQVTVAAGTLLGADNRPAELDGYGPLHPDIARDLAGRNNGWTRLFLDPSGMIIETDTYTPTESMRRFLRARDQHCRFPGCRMPAHRCEIDHNHDHAKGGSTSIDNLSHFCRTHHTLKHPDIPDPHRWTALQESDGGVSWHSPLGRDYSDPSPRRVMFV